MGPAAVHFNRVDNSPLQRGETLTMRSSFVEGGVSQRCEPLAIRRLWASQPPELMLFSAERAFSLTKAGTPT